MSPAPAAAAETAELLARAGEAPALLAEADPVQAALAAYAAAARGAFAANTERAVRADTVVFASWCTAAGLSSALPVAAVTMAAFVDAMAEIRKPATVTRYVASLNHLHRAAGLPLPGAAEATRLALRRMRRAHGTRQRQAAPLGWDRLRRIVSSLADSLIDRRDAALLLLAYDTLARRSELAALEVADLGRDADGTGTALIRRSKTDQDGAGRLAFVSAATMAALEAWLAAAGITAGPLFVPLGNARTAPGLGEGDIARIFRRRAGAAGLAMDGVGGHSTRVGAAQDMLAHNLGIAAIQQAGGWTSPRMPARYGERLEAKRSGAAILAGIQGR
jgi:integrase